MRLPGHKLIASFDLKIKENVYSKESFLSVNYQLYIGTKPNKEMPLYAGTVDKVAK